MTMTENLDYHMKCLVDKIRIRQKEILKGVCVGRVNARFSAIIEQICIDDLLISEDDIVLSVPLYGTEILEASALRNYFQSIGYICQLATSENNTTSRRGELPCTFILKFTIKKSDLLKHKGMI